MQNFHFICDDFFIPRNAKEWSLLKVYDRKIYAKYEEKKSNNNMLHDVQKYCIRESRKRKRSDEEINAKNYYKRIAK